MLAVLTLPNAHATLKHTLSGHQIITFDATAADANTNTNANTNTSTKPLMCRSRASSPRTSRGSNRCWVAGQTCATCQCDRTCGGGVPAADPSCVTESRCSSLGSEASDAVFSAPAPPKKQLNPRTVNRAPFA